MLTVGLDVHKHFTYAKALDENGVGLWEEKFASTPGAIEAFARKRLTSECQVALEATTNCLPFARLLRQYAGRVVISNPMQTKVIAHARVKTDKVDAEVLAQLLRADFLPTIWEPDEKTQELRRRVAHRQALSSMRVQTKNRIHSILHRNLVEVPKFSDLFGKKGRAYLEQLEGLPADDKWQLQHELRMLDSVAEQVDATDTYLAERANEKCAGAALDDHSGHSIQDRHRFDRGDRPDRSLCQSAQTGQLLWHESTRSAVRKWRGLDGKHFQMWPRPCSLAHHRSSPNRVTLRRSLAELLQQATQ